MQDETVALHLDRQKIHFIQISLLIYNADTKTKM